MLEKRRCCYCCWGGGVAIDCCVPLRALSLSAVCQRPGHGQATRHSPLPTQCNAGMTTRCYRPFSCCESVCMATRDALCFRRQTLSNASTVGQGECFALPDYTNSTQAADSAPTTAAPRSFIRRRPMDTTTFCHWHNHSADLLYNLSRVSVNRAQHKLHTTTLRRIACPRYNLLST